MTLFRRLFLPALLLLVLAGRLTRGEDAASPAPVKGADLFSAGSKNLLQAFQAAERNELTREGFIRQCAFHEYRAILRTRAFYVDVYFPWARAKKIETSPEQWRVDISVTFEGWLGGYDDHSSYPWEPYGRYYESMAGQKDLEQELGAQENETKGQK